ncbi:hypothetical protein PAEPH01_0026 [Pancytospora epiphaga]|nr:hypothetical protein PAEPH01_0026 [Pancytospora epiphaga]
MTILIVVRPMTELKEILEAMKIDLEIPERNPLPEIVRSSPSPRLNTSPQTAEELNIILSHYGLPTFNESDELRKKLAVVESLERQGICMSTNSMDLQRSLEKVEEYRKIEADCDKYEIEIANQEGGNNMEYRDMTLDDLRSLVSQKHKEYEIINSLSSNDIARVNEILNSRDLSRLSGFLESMCSETTGIAAYARAVDLLQDKQDDWCKAVLLVISGTTSVDELSIALNTDRVGVLRVIYQLCSKGILDYDRLADTVCIANIGQ